MKPANNLASAAHVVDLAKAYGWPDRKVLRPGMSGFGEAVAAVQAAHALWGKAAASDMWHALGLPPPRPRSRPPGQPASDEASAQIASFIEERLERDAGFSVSSSELYGAYVVWCDDTDQPSVTPALFGRRLSQLGCPSRKDRGRMRYRGLRIRLER